MHPHICSAIRVLFCSLLLLATLPAHSAEKKATLIEIDGAIGPATANYVQNSFRKAIENDSELIIIRMDTPGGLDLAMRDIIQAILLSPIPVVTYVSPSGARAASAGTYILYASHFAAMAPATNLGAATPVHIGMPEMPKTDKQTEQPETSKDVLSRKATNDAIAYIQGLAEMRGRNIEWAELAVREAASLTASEALAKNVIDIVATDIADLLTQLDGRSVKVVDHTVTLNTQGMLVQHEAPGWRAKLLAIISDPNIAYILMMVGIYGLIYEFANPGMILPGVAGAICLLLALFAFQIMPINYTGLALILLGITFMVAEMFVPSFGALGIGGVVAFVIGSVILLDSNVPGYQVAWPIIGTFALTSAGFFMFMIKMMISARQQPIVSGEEELIHSVGEAVEDFTGNGRIRLHSESWLAHSNEHITRGQKVRVTRRDGLKLEVEPLHATNPGENP